MVYVVARVVVLVRTGLILVVGGASDGYCGTGRWLALDSRRKER